MQKLFFLIGTTAFLLTRIWATDSDNIHDNINGKRKPLNPIENVYGAVLEELPIKSLNTPLSIITQPASQKKLCSNQESPPQIVEQNPDGLALYKTLIEIAVRLYPKSLEKTEIALKLSQEREKTSLFTQNIIYTIKLNLAAQILAAQVKEMEDLKLRLCEQAAFESIKKSCCFGEF